MQSYRDWRNWWEARESRDFLDGLNIEISDERHLHINKGDLDNWQKYIVQVQEASRSEKL